jgi:hypothetical protein
MTLTDDRVSPAWPDDRTRVLFEEARRRRHRRYGAAGVTLVLVIALVTGLLLSFGSARPASPVPTGAAASGSLTGHQVRTVSWAGSFVADQVVAAGGKIWVFGSTASGPQCTVEEVDPTNLRTRQYPLPACGSYFAVGGDRIYMAESVFTLATDSDAFHIESFNMTTHTAVVMAPVDITTTGTGRAHMAMAYGAGWLWLAPWNDEVLQISPSTGAVVRSVTGVPASNGGHPVMVGGRSGLWITGGVGGPGSIEQVEPGAATARTVFSGSRREAVWFMSVVDKRLWAQVATAESEGRRFSFSARLMAFNAAGRPVLSTPSEPAAVLSVAATGDQLWLLRAGPDCTGRQQLERIDGRTGTSVVTASWPSPVVACPNGVIDNQMAAVAGHVFVLVTGQEPGGPGELVRIA